MDAPILKHSGGTSSVLFPSHNGVSKEWQSLSAEKKMNRGSGGESQSRGENPRLSFLLGKLLPLSVRCIIDVTYTLYLNSQRYFDIENRFYVTKSFQYTDWKLTWKLF